MTEARKLVQKDMLAFFISKIESQVIHDLKDEATMWMAMGNMKHKEVIEMFEEEQKKILALMYIQKIHPMVFNNYLNSCEGGDE